jgi:protein-disulfide isomerase
MEKNQILTVLLTVAIVLSVVNIYGTWQIKKQIETLPSGGAVPAAPSAPSVPSGPVDVSEAGNPSMGDAKAPVTIIEFSDFECPFCGRYVTQTYPQIKKDYVDTGKVRIVFRDYPLPFHSNAQKAAEAAECADDQGKFWEMHSKLFSNQQALSVANLKKYAGELALDQTKFDECLDSGKHAAEVQQDLADGSAAGVSGTPSFFVNGMLLVGAQPYSEFKKLIDAELAK